MNNNSFSVEKAVVIRQPSTANLMIDSADRNSFLATPWNFSISRPNSILNGFFTRIGTSEVVLEWNIPNITNDLSNSQITITDTSGNISHTITLPDGFYSVADALDAIVSLANTAFGGNNFSITHVGEQYFLSHTGGAITVSLDYLTLQIGLDPTLTATNIPIKHPDLRGWRFLDFVSPQLTYNQDLKDSSTNQIVRDVLCRWFMSWDNPVEYDAYGFPILMGYKAFTCRRLFSPPKQIKWDNTQPIGNLSFEVYGYGGNFTPYTTGILLSKIYAAGQNTYTNWLMTLQLSEN